VDAIENKCLNGINMNDDEETNKKGEQFSMHTYSICDPDVMLMIL